MENLDINFNILSDDILFWYKTTKIRIPVVDHFKKINILNIFFQHIYWKKKP